MKTTSVIAGFLILATTFGHAVTNDLTGALQRGLFEEEANRNLEAAAQAYQAVSTQFDKDRALAATAIFRLGEIYRKQNKTNEAVAQYERIVREFSDQNTLVTLSRQNIAGLGGTEQTRPTVAANTTTSDNLQSQYALLKAQLEQARKETNVLTIAKLLDDADLRETLQNERRVIRTPEAQQKVLDTAAARALDYAEKRLSILQSVIAQARSTQSAAATDQEPATDDEEKEIRRIQEMIRNSPDLINGAPTVQSPLCFAALNGYTRLAKSLLDNGADINRATGGGTPLQVAVQAGHKAMVELLLQRGADVNARNSIGQTALHVAAESGFQAVAKALLAAEAEVNSVSANQSTPLLLAAGKGHADLVRFVISQGADVDAPNNSGTTSLMNAAQPGHAETVSVLLSAKANPDALDKEGRTALSYAAAGGHLETVKALLAAKADPNAGSTSLPLHAAIHQKSPTVVEALLRAGADPNRVANIRWQFTDGGETYGFNGRYAALSPLFIAIKESTPEIVKLLLDFKADPNAKSPQDVPLIFSVVKQTEMLKAFLNAGADPNATVNGASPLSMAYSVAGVHLLLAAGADIEKGQGNLSPLLIWADKGDLKPFVEVCEALLKGGANVMARNALGQTALHLAANARAPELISLLLSNKADVNARDNNGMTPLDLVTGSREKLRQHNSLGSVYQFDKPALNDRTAALLRQHGGQRDLPKTDRIEVRRLESDYSKAVFVQGTNDWNQFTLLEALFGNYYLGQAMRPPLSADLPLPERVSQSTRSLSPTFPNLHRVVVVRQDPKTGQTAQRIEVDLLQPTGALTCESDIPLQFGDVVEILEREHTLQEAEVGLTTDELVQIAQCREGVVELVVRGKRTPLKVWPTYTESAIGPVLGRTEARQALFSSSDLSRVKVTRRGPAGGKPHEWVIDCSAGKAPDLWLRDGDVIEVPDKL